MSLGFKKGEGRMSNFAKKSRMTIYVNKLDKTNK